VYLQKLITCETRGSTNVKDQNDIEHIL
jgi:hypothetical protein